MVQVVLHLGAHRTGTTSFQAFAAEQCPDRCAVWVPRDTRNGLLGGLHAFPHSAATLARIQGRIATACTRLDRQGINQLLVSDENFMGSLHSNLKNAALYLDAGLRVARIAAAFGAPLRRVLVQIRCFDSYWASVLAFLVARGFAPPSPAELRRLVLCPRGWRHVIRDLACALPGAEIIVTPFESFAQRPDLLLARALDCATDRAAGPLPWFNAAHPLPHLRRVAAEAYPERLAFLPRGDGRWQPFTPAQRQQMRARYSTDLAWLRGGADGLATYQEISTPRAAARAATARQTTRGSKTNDSQERRMARPC